VDGKSHARMAQEVKGHKSEKQGKGVCNEGGPRCSIGEKKKGGGSKIG